MADVLRHIVAQSRAGVAVALPSVCSAQPEVIEAALLRAHALDSPIVIEATSNQVNQDGGYTGMTPAAFAEFVGGIAARAGVGSRRFVLGGDHLGPQAWRASPAEAAMTKAEEMVAAYVRAGFTKIHLDCSQGCAGEPEQVDDATAAARSARLAAVCLQAAPNPNALAFVIGTEVPPPGGARQDEAGDIPATTPESVQATLAAHKAAFEAAGLTVALDRIVGLVAQPGVEFSPMQVHHLPLARNPLLKEAISHWPGLVLEAHSTDYQHPEAFVRLAALGFAFQKVGPALTFAYRQALYGLDHLRHLAGWADGAEPLDHVMERLMLADPSHWQGHYRGAPDALRLMRHFGFADRIRYYWPRPEAQAAVKRLLDDLAARDLPVPLLWQSFGPDVLARAETLRGPRPRALVLAAVQLALDPYFLPDNTQTGEAAGQC